MIDKIPDFSDHEYWRSKLQQYVDGNVHIPGDSESVWEYFKFCLQTQNRYHFQNALIPVILEKLKQNTFNLEKGEKIYRARIDVERKYEKLCRLERDIRTINKQILTEENLEENNNNKKDLQIAVLKHYLRDLTAEQNDPDYSGFHERYLQGFEGFDAKGSGAAPYDRSKAGRCNSEHVSYLYAANDEHTAVAEVRPYIRDAVSVATLIVEKDLKLVDFYFDYDEHGTININDILFHDIRSEFTAINKGNTDEYLTTQYITSMAQAFGFDGIRFRSSLVFEGINYVIFSNENCKVLCSKMYVIPIIEYTLEPIIPDE